MNRSDRLWASRGWPLRGYSCGTREKKPLGEAGESQALEPSDQLYRGRKGKSDSRGKRRQAGTGFHTMYVVVSGGQSMSQQ